MPILRTVSHPPSLALISLLFRALISAISFVSRLSIGVENEQEKGKKCGLTGRLLSARGGFCWPFKTLERM